MSKKPVGHKARKRFGQNFLQDQGIIRRIIRSIGPQENQHLVEIGPGLGAITEELIPECQHLDVVELDRDLIPVLRTKFFNFADKFEIHEADALKFDFSALYKEPQQLRVVGNLPYNISTPLIFHLLSYNEQIEDMHFMLQKEVVDRLAAQPGESAYGRLGIMAQYYCHVEPLFIVPPEAFDPRPKVDSAIVRLIPYKKIPHPAQDVDKLELVVRTAFGQRRKTLRNNLKPLISAEDIQALDIDPGIRPERLSLQEFIRISDFLSSKQSD